MIARALVGVSPICAYAKVNVKINNLKRCVAHLVPTKTDHVVGDLL